MERVATGRPVTDVVSAGAGDRRGYVLSLGGSFGSSGRIDIFDPDTGTFAATPFLPSVDGSREAFGLAFAPDYATSGSVYVSYRTPYRRHMVTRYTAVPGEDRLDPASARTILTIDHLSSTSGGPHYGADIAFGPDGCLYVTRGDSDGPITGVSVAQDVRDPGGSVLRIDPTRDDLPGDDGNNFGVPADNPDFGADAAPGLWAIGLRNPFKADWDAATGRYFIADVGEDRQEEVDLGAAGANYGWPAFEGPIASTGSFPPDRPAGTPTAPLYAYDHGDDPFEGFSVTGGLVHRGVLSDLFGQYVLGDFGGFGGPSTRTGDRIWSFDAVLGSDGGVTSYDLILAPGAALSRVPSFGSDGAGNLYVAAFADGDLFRVAAAQVAPVPLPAAAGFLIAALGGLAAAARRRG